MCSSSCWDTSHAFFSVMCRADARFAPSQWETLLLCSNVSHWLGASRDDSRFAPANERQHYFVTMSHWLGASRADSRFAPSQWETALLCNDVSHWLGASLESALMCANWLPLLGLLSRYLVMWSSLQLICKLDYQCQWLALKIGPQDNSLE